VTEQAFKDHGSFKGYLGFAGPHAFYNWLSKKKSDGLKDD
jgi:hypothetical protein